MVLSKEDLLNSVKSLVDRVGGDTPFDDDIKFLEDVTDTVADFETKIGDSMDWKTKYDELDASWRKRYRDRFFGRSDDPGPDTPPKEPDDDGKKSYEDLFKQGN